MDRWREGRMLGRKKIRKKSVKTEGNRGMKTITERRMREGGMAGW